MRSQLLSIEGNLNSNRYIREALEPKLLPLFQVTPHAIFQQHNLLPNGARNMKDFFNELRVPLHPWPARSPDMSPIEHVWDMIGLRLVRHGPPATTVDVVWTSIQTTWRGIPQEHNQVLFNAMPRCLGGQIAVLAEEAPMTECVFILEAPTGYQLSLQLHDVSIPQNQPGAAANCSSAPAVRVYNYTSLGELVLAAECLAAADIIDDPAVYKLLQKHSARIAKWKTDYTEANVFSWASGPSPRPPHQASAAYFDIRCRRTLVLVHKLPNTPKGLIEQRIFPLRSRLIQPIVALSPQSTCSYPMSLGGEIIISQWPVQSSGLPHSNSSSPTPSAASSRARKPPPPPCTQLPDHRSPSLIMISINDGDILCHVTTYRVEWRDLGALNSEVLRADAGEATAGTQERGKQEIPEKTHRPAASPGHDSHMRKSGSDPARNRTRLAYAGGGQPDHSDIPCSQGLGKYIIAWSITYRGHEALRSDVALSVDRGQLLSLPTNAVVLTTTLTSGQFDLLASIHNGTDAAAATPAPATSAASTSALLQAAAVEAVEPSYDYEQEGGVAGGSGEPPAYDESDDLNMVDVDLQHGDTREATPRRVGAAFDSVTHKAVLQALTDQGVDIAYIRILHFIYDTSSAFVSVSEPTTDFRIEEGVKQGDPYLRITKVKDISEKTATMKWQWAGHVPRTKYENWAKTVLEWSPRNRPRPRGRPPYRWDKDISRVAGVNWQRITKDRSTWRRLFEVVPEFLTLRGHIIS
ncbi:hypothetical protein PR048_008062 [Dryococelus australis]|uniref:Uncharacterized protein n=1 Tax=Dryococelus australis TaxID=614101 RepID=A0ABQ9HW16_9NEOP|nr:hypothetical protein PR048_008062 [Dryococelus australis]